MIGGLANVLEKSQFRNFLYSHPYQTVEPGKGYLYFNSDDRQVIQL